ncbi:ABC transporter ATP-binding protein [Methanimicrococcus blatticola]|uniref:Cobalamin import ATP-binding protein BtuD n=1 Tax=Methanimicrococcus blatticola TaxID=91560 RepID=A0A484F4Z4_9EURY|nr:ABC transporter ATP-binding protein [Methanimicrococcus blatticola]MBZ3936143.1 ABC transporter ATP-binding protein [Methanimicrococcus blatticola]MCC2508386.1 ABC transporter ATP-binding protein [Methanimicrococcus blatticola]TDQ70161.1 iron complex transport system ATP-binding protein [Methanimicrococcus blatticola]
MNFRVNGVHFDYKSRKVLNGVELNVNQGEILAIMGPNGVGKSTLLKCMDMILKPTAGSVLIDETDLVSLSKQEIAKRVGYVSQRNEVSRTTVFDAVLLGRKPHVGLKITENDYNIVDAALKRFDLEDMQLRRIDEMSGGELQKVCICRAIAQEPNVLLLDEPTSSLDLHNQLEILKIIRNVTEGHQTATVLTMHDLNLALRFADKFVFMKDGIIHDACDAAGVTPEMIENIYGVKVQIEYFKGMPYVIPE